MASSRSIPGAQTCVVERGIVLDELNSALAPHGLMFGPRPATHDHCTLGGILGNNSCGATAQAYGKTVHNVLRLEVLTYGGERFWAGPTSDEEYAAIVAASGRRAEIYQTLRELSAACADQIRERYPRIPRRVSGYNLDSLLPGRGFDVARALVGSESTLVTTCTRSCAWRRRLRPRRWWCWDTRTSSAWPTPCHASRRTIRSSSRAWTTGSSGSSANGG